MCTPQRHRSACPSRQSRVYALHCLGCKGPKASCRQHDVYSCLFVSLAVSQLKNKKLDWCFVWICLFYVVWEPGFIFFILHNGAVHLVFVNISCLIVFCSKLCTFYWEISLHIWGVVFVYIIQYLVLYGIIFSPKLIHSGTHCLV